MLEFIIENLATIVISLLLLAAVTGIAVKLIKDWRAGKTSCGCGYSACPMSGTCHQKK